MMLRRAAAITAGLAMAAGVGLVGVGTASAVTPASLHIQNGATWTIETNEGGCEQDVFASNGTFVSDDYGDSGTWSGGVHTIKLKWTAGNDAGLKFHGTYTPTATPKQFTGSFGGTGVGSSGELIKGALGC